jgi:uncharacterized protein YggL (DUF469 family)
LKEHAVWTNLDSQSGPIKLLDPKYEHAHVATPINLPESGFVKNNLFNNKWGEIYLKAELYQDTYFSLVTETVFDYPYSLRSEKIYKPIAMGHPFVAAANRGYYKDLHSAGFQTFGNLIDESFDQIDDPRDRANRIVDVVADICYNGAASFLESARSVCKYNYQQLREHNRRERAELPERLAQYINE